MWRSSPATFHIPLSVLRETNDEIAHGGFSEIIKGVDLRSNTEVAIKRISPRFFEGRAPEDREEQAVSLFENEKAKLEFLSRLDAPNIVKYFGYTVRDENYCIVTEISSFGSLDKYLVELQSNPRASYKIMQGAARGLEFMHRHHLLHCDIKPSNLLIFANWEAKWCDFGLAVSIESREWIQEGVYRGTPIYMAPEVLRKEKVGKKSDVFSLGIFLFEMRYGRNPNSHFTAHADLIDSYELGEYLSLLSPTAREKNKVDQLIGWSMEYNPLDRPNMLQLLGELQAPNDQLVDENIFRKKLVIKKLSDEIKKIILNFLKIKITIEKAANGLLSELNTLDIDHAGLKQADLKRLQAALVQLEFLQSVSGDVLEQEVLEENDLFKLAAILDSIFCEGFIAPSILGIAYFQAAYWFLIHKKALKQIFPNLNFPSTVSNLYSNLKSLLSSFLELTNIFVEVSELLKFLENNNLDSVKFMLPTDFIGHVCSFYNTNLALSRLVKLIKKMDSNARGKLPECDNDVVLDFIKEMVESCLNFSDDDFVAFNMAFKEKLKAITNKPAPMLFFSSSQHDESDEKKEQSVSRKSFGSLEPSKK